MERAACAGQAPPDKRNNPDAVDPWFPENGQSPNTGKLICASCTVRDECKDYANRTGSKAGMWGGEIASRKKKS